MAKGRVATKYTDQQLISMLKQGMTTGLKDASPLYEAKWIDFLSEDGKLRISIEDVNDLENNPWTPTKRAYFTMLEYEQYDFLVHNDCLSPKMKEALTTIKIMRDHVQMRVDLDFARRCFAAADGRVEVND